MRIASIVLCMLLFPSMALAGTPFDGFHVGAKAGINALNVFMELEDEENREVEDNHDRGWSPTGGVFIGGGKAIKEVFYLGGEVDATYHGLSADPSRQETLSLDWSFGATFRIGGVIAKRHLLYGLAGLRLGLMDYDNDTGFDYEFDYSCDCDDGAANGCDDRDDDRLSDEDHPVVGGARIGLGYEYALTDHLGLRAETAYTVYGPLRYEYLDGARQYWDETIVPGVFDATLGVAYHF